jgi:formylglycine-generating enzyme required for sulfatase activity
VEGQLQALGTPDQLIRFTSWPIDASTPPKVGDWYGLRIAGGPNQVARMKYCTFEYGIIGASIASRAPLTVVDQCVFQTNKTYGLLTYFPVTLLNSRFQGNQSDGVYINGTTVTASNCWFVYNNANGGNGDGTANLLCTQCNVSSNSASGLAIDSVHFTQGSVIGNSGHGLIGNEITMIDSSVIGNSGRGLSGSKITMIDSICSSNRGINVYGSTIVATGSRFEEGGDTGIYVRCVYKVVGGNYVEVPGFANISDCIIRRNVGSGLHCYVPAIVTVSNSIIADNSYGIDTEGSSKYEDAHILISGCTVNNNAGVGIAAYYHAVSILNSVVTGNKAEGVNVGGGIVKGNIIERNNIGIFINTVHVIELTNNCITDNLQYELMNGSSGVIVADGNYWGEPTTTELTNGVRKHSKIYDSRYDSSKGQVLIRTWLNARPPLGISAPPQSQTTAAGGNATFVVIAAGPPPLSYQWYKDGIVIQGAIYASLTVSNITYSDLGMYTVMASNKYGSETSPAAYLSVDPPIITMQPQSQSVAIGSPAAFTVEASGSFLSYQWRFNGAKLDAATNVTYMIASVQTNNGGQYSVEVSNAGGSVVSSNAVLVIRLPPHFEPVTKVQGNYQTLVKGAPNDILAVDISTDLVNWTPFQNVRIGFGGLLVQIITNQDQIFFRARTLYPLTGMVWIPAGTFTMGSPLTEVDRQSNEGPQTQVTLSQGFWMSQYETTQEEYLAVMGSNPSHFTGDLNRPVEMVNWNDAISYCAKLTAHELAAGRLPAGYAYRLPTEAEWEYACRAGTTTRFSYGDDLGYTQLGNYAWYSENSGGKIHAVGGKLPNAWGLYDMQGNVWELCLDWYSESFPGGSVTDPRGPTTGSLRVIRGGGLNYYGGACRSACRLYFTPDYGGGGLGFRPVLAPGQ